MTAQKNLASSIEDPINNVFTSEQKIAALRDMLRIRRFEQQSFKLYQQEKIGGFLHLYVGQESVAVAAVGLMSGADEMITAYRDHGHALAVGMSMEECMAELFGKATGCSKGKGGSMHFFAPDKHYWGGHGIVAGQVPLGLGLAFALKYKKIPGCALCFLGDGAVNQGVFSESLNLASLWDLPLVFIIENNGYSMGTSLERSSSIEGSLAERAVGFKMEREKINGNNFYELRAKLHNVMERARHQCKPSLLEITTYRYYGHSIADANHKKYRSAEEIHEYQKNHDPIMLWEEQLLKEGVITPSTMESLDQAAKEEVAAAILFAEASPWPEPASIFSDIYSEVDVGSDAAKRGTYFFSDTRL